MKESTEFSIIGLRSEVVLQCFNKFKTNPDIAEGFIGFVSNSFLQTNQNPQENEGFRNDLTTSIREQNFPRFTECLNFLNQEQLLKIAEVERLNLGSHRSETYPALLVSQTSAQDPTTGRLYSDLVFAHTLPKAFKDLTEEQKARLQSLNSELFGDQAKALTNRDYSSISTMTKRKLFEYARKDLFGEEVNIGKTNRLFVFKLGEKLDEMSVESRLIDLISGELIDFQSEFNKQIKAEPKIKGMMVRNGIASSEESLEVAKNPHKSANETYTVKDRDSGKKYYAKTFDKAISTQGKLNPNELFLYKVMEYVGYGPKTDFLVEFGSSSAGKSSIFKGNFILTEDVSRPNQDFFLDMEENRDALVQFARHDPRKFAIEISAAAALTDILSIADVFGQNAKNYGIVGNPDNPSEYKIQFVDHQPNPGNGLFSTLREEERLAYSPRESLPRKFGDRSLTPLTGLALESRSGEFVRRAIQAEVHERLFHREDPDTTLESAIEKARDDVAKLVTSASINFVDNAISNLESYITKIQGNIATYQKSLERSPQEERGRK